MIIVPRLMNSKPVS